MIWNEANHPFVSQMSSIEHQMIPNDAFNWCIVYASLNSRNFCPVDAKMCGYSFKSVPLYADGVDPNAFNESSEPRIIAFSMSR